MFQALIKLFIIAEGMNYTMLANYKLGEIVPVDIHCHPLTLSNDEMRHYKGQGWYCRICQNKSIHISIIFFHFIAINVNMIYVIDVFYYMIIELLMTKWKSVHLKGKKFMLPVIHIIYY